ncbi:FAD-dependent oxidoreductase [Paenalkalicoccus suaedae]|uniref:FAD-dependent oxidoreductase n=1 Tax=Paenalkalicoccus suaedae TaxID=2592382 RepID=A0A859FIC4_9BACI|nr:FAD-dependent oxidoreductase [Paenalkalicoccus suaedae]QKS72907.1 FAD-dependent oxidoreductase [Paenalkalicoccus suaedae]
MKLVTGSSYWATTLPTPKTYPAVTEPITCDVLIVGGGSSAAQCAYYLADQGLDVVVVEKNEIGHGSTLANTALLQYAGEKLFTDLIHQFGENWVNRHITLCRQAIDDIETASKTCQLDFQYKRRQSAYFASTEQDLPKLQKEMDYLETLKLPVEYASQETIQSRYSFTKSGAIFFKDDAEFNPYRFTHSLFDYAASKGVRIFEQSPVSNIHGTPKGASARCGSHEIDAKHVIIAAGYDGLDIHKDKNASFVCTFTVTTDPVANFDGWYERSLIWETARPYYYMRTTPDNRIIIGGLDETRYDANAQQKHMHHKREQLMQELSARFPHLELSPAFFSSAAYGGTHDGLPIIGRYESHPGCTFLFGLGDNGTVYSMVLARIITDDLLGKNNPDIELYKDTRKNRSRV